MAVDTVKLRSPYLSEELAAAIEEECTKRMAVEVKTGALLWDITTGDLKGSYDSRISIKVSRMEWRAESHKGLNAVVMPKGSGKVRTTLVECKPYVEIEASVHKLFLGHNVYGGTEDFQKACVYLLNKVEQILNVKLPGHIRNDYEKHWLVRRIDFAYIFNLGSMEAVQQFFYLFRNGYYPRRNIRTYGLTGWLFTASTSSTKAYHKGPDFRLHDMKRLISAGVLTESQAFDMLVLATEILRVEVEIKSRKLKYDFQKTRYGHEPYIKDITSDYLHSVYETEISRIMKEGKKKSDIVRDSAKVEERLKNMYSESKANSLFSAYLKMSNFGIEKYKLAVPKRTYYRHIKELKEAGVSVNLTGEFNLEEVTGFQESLLPEDFQPLRDDPRRMSGEDAQIDMLIAQMQAEIKKDFHMAVEAQNQKSALAINS